ncbi:unnamed protein product [Bursaphelenchus xylophilus]|uniref:(pine wood nematode) hypothetical protein n=1 Tax=Bursaphelenchus xylophilus TaxID=6326 RepID=A0A1I7RHP5_BURXY|nr:unnamed protein product [Bursaphelenchus xylophilus]CAG9115523.1 unnamed protein product [Bursaphelenchus xylophilus]
MLRISQPAKYVILSSRTSIQTGRSMRCYGDAPAMPSIVTPFLTYFSDANITQGLNIGMELIHGTGLPWVGTFVVAGLGLRLATAPFHVYAEKLFARRINAYNYFQTEVLKRVAKNNNKPIVPDESGTKLVIANDPELTAKASKAAEEALMKYVVENKLHSSRIQTLKLCTVPFWIYSSFAIRNVISADFAPALNGFLWIDDFLLPDPYFVLPVAVAVFGFLNLYSQRLIFPRQPTTLNKFYDGFLGAFTMAATLIMIKMPACIPLYWLTVSATGLVQSLLLRHPKVKSLLGISRLPYDTRTPLRDLFLLRKRQKL